MRRLAYYAIGLAIGFVMLGMFQNLRTREHAARQAAQPAAQAPSRATDPKQGAVETPEPASGSPHTAPASATPPD